MPRLVLSVRAKTSLDQLDDEEFQNITIDPLLALQHLRVSRLLPSRNGRKNLLRDLPGLISAVDSEDFNYDRVKCVIGMSQGDATRPAYYLSDMP